MIFAGIDAGSTYVKVAIIDENETLKNRIIEPTEPFLQKQLDTILNRICNDYDEEILIVSTGYGKKLVKKAYKKVSEISAHAKGIYSIYGKCTLIDIGGQDSKVIVVGEKGTIVDFAMNDKCAAGTGRFIENVARRLGMSFEQVESVARKASGEFPISSTCVVFAETEIISLISEGAEVSDIVKGVYRSLVKRVVALAKSVDMIKPIAVSGGVVKSGMIVEMLSEELGSDIKIPDDPQIIGALGAALIARDTV